MATILRGSSIEIKIAQGESTKIIGERINPTGKKALREALKAGNLEYIAEEAKKQEEQGASIIDVNVGMPGVDQEVMLPAAVKMVAEVSGLPISIDSSNPKAIEAALKICPGRALINSTTGEEASLEAILPLAKEYKAAVIALCFDESGIAMEVGKRLNIATKIVDRATKVGLDLEDIIFDPLVTSLGSDDQAASITLETIKALRKRYGNSITVGASNVSFGLPDRPFINSIFLGCAVLLGVNVPISDPGSVTILDTIRAADLSAGRDPHCREYLRNFRAKRAAKKG
jgi:5-methyltetrahydrofolate--homocysteine methyltransferase